MKYLLIAFISTALSSCMINKTTCQYFKTESTNVNEVKGQYLYEDSLVIISYNLWASGGQLAFTIFNKTNVPIYVNWKNSNFVFMGYNNQYWSDEVTSNKISASTARGTEKYQLRFQKKMA